MTVSSPLNAFLHPQTVEFIQNFCPKVVKNVGEFLPEDFKELCLNWIEIAMTVCFNTAFSTSPDNFWAWMLNVFSMNAFRDSEGQVSYDYSKKFHIEPDNLTRNDCVELVERIYGDFVNENFQNRSGGTLIGYSPEEKTSAVCLTDFFLYLNAWFLVIFMVTCYVFRRERRKAAPAAVLATKSESAQTTPELSTLVLSPMGSDEEEPEESLLDITLPEYEEIVVENGIDYQTISTRIFTDNLSQKDLSDFDSLGETIQEEDAFLLHGTCEDSGSEEDEAEDQKENDEEIVEAWTSDLFDRLKHLDKVEKIPNSPVSPTPSPTKTPSKRSSKNFLEINIEKVKQLTPRKNAHRLCKSSDSDTKLNQSRKSGIPVRKSSHQKLPFTP